MQDFDTQTPPHQQENTVTEASMARMARQALKMMGFDPLPEADDVEESDIRLAQALAQLNESRPELAVAKKVQEALRSEDPQEVIRALRSLLTDLREHLPVV